MNLIILGAPGAGKGTISKILVDKHGIVQVSTGDILRKEIANETELGKAAKSYIDAGDLVPDDVVLGMIEKILKSGTSANGFIMDGFPRTIAQAKGFDTLLEKNSMNIDAVIELQIDDDVVIKRLTSRRTCSNSECQAIYNVLFQPPKVDGICDKCGSELIQRSDENEDVIRTRLETYYEKTQPLISYYSKHPNYHAVKADDPSDIVLQNIESFIS